MNLLVEELINQQKYSHVFLQLYHVYWQGTKSIVKYDFQINVTLQVLIGIISLVDTSKQASLRPLSVPRPSSGLLGKHW